MLPSQVFGTLDMATSGTRAVLGTYGLEIGVMGRLKSACNVRPLDQRRETAESR